MESDEWNKLVLLGAGVVATKLFVTTMLGVRNRLMTGEVAQEEDNSSPMLKNVFAILKPATLAYGPTIVTHERCADYARNCVEHEVPVLLAAFALGPVGAPVWAGTALTVFLASRVVHGGFFLAGQQPLRTISYLPSFFAMGIIGTGAIYVALQEKQ